MRFTPRPSDLCNIATMADRKHLTTWLRNQPMANLGGILLIAFILMALFAPWLAPHDPAQLDLNARLMSPSAHHWFGTDELGRDVLSRIIYGARISLTVAVSVVAISLALGLVLGG